MENKREPFFYDSEVEWTEQRRGRLRAPRLPALEVAAPPEFQGHEGCWTPEHLYVAAVNACFMTIFLAIAANSKLDVVSFSASAKGKLEKIDGGGFQITEIVLRPTLLIPSAEQLELARRIIDKAEKSCLIANSIKTVVKVEPEIYHKQNPAYPCPSVSSATVAS